MTDPLVTVDGLEKYYYENDTLLDRLTGAEPEAVQAVDGVSFEVREGETLGVVGESGCGKSTLAETLMRLRDPTGGSVTFDGEPVFELSGGDLDAFRRRAQVMFQDPFSSLDPRMTAGEIITEPLAIHDVGPVPSGASAPRVYLRRSVSPPTRSTGIPTSSPAGSASASDSPAHSPSIRSSSSSTSRCRRST